MDKQRFYEPIGEWLINTKGCQRNDYFLGYTTEPEIRWEGAGTTTPDIVGVHYEWTGNTNGSQDFHFHVVEVETEISRESIDMLIGKIETDRRYVRSGNVAADSVSLYVALPAVDIPPELQQHAQENGIGILRLETSTESENYVLVREVLPPTRIECSRSDILSNSSQASRGIFCDQVRKTAILRRLITQCDQFFQSEIRNPQKAYNREMNRRNFCNHIESETARAAAIEVLEFIDDHESLTLSPPESGIKTGNISLPVEHKRGEISLILVSQTSNFKINDPQGTLLFRIAGSDNIEISKDKIETLTGVKEWIGEHIA